MITLPIEWREKEEKAVAEVEQIDMKTEMTFLGIKGMKNMNIRTKRESYKEIVRLTDNSRKIFGYQVEERIFNKEGLDQKMKIWITKLKDTDLIIERDGLRSMKPIIDWNKDTVLFKKIQIEKISEWLRNLKEIFGELPEGQLSPQGSGIDYAIHLLQNQISPSSLIPAKPSDNELIKEYLDKILIKGWIITSNSALEISLFMISKEEGRRSVVDYRKLNFVTGKNSNTLSLIKNILDQIQEAQ